MPKVSPFNSARAFVLLSRRFSTRLLVANPGKFARTLAQAAAHFRIEEPSHERFLQSVIQICGRIPVSSAPELLNIFAALLKDSNEAAAPQNFNELCALLLTNAERFAAINATGALFFLRSGREFLKLNNAAAFAKWSQLCDSYARANASVFRRFAADAFEPTRALVLLSQEKNERKYHPIAAALDGAISVAARDLNAAAKLYETAPRLLARISPQAFQRWVAHGLESPFDTDALAAYFADESRTSADFINNSDDALRLREVSFTLGNYARMLCGEAVQLVASDECAGVIEISGEREIQMPSAIQDESGGERAFRLYKALAAIGAGQIEFNTHESGTKALHQLRAEIIARFPQTTANEETNWQALIALFSNQILARKVFNIVENARVELRLRAKYKGIRRELDLLGEWRREEQAAHARQKTNALTKRQADFLRALYEEALVRERDANSGDDFPSSRADEESNRRAEIRRTLAKYVHRNSSVADSVRACLSLYECATSSEKESFAAHRQIKASDRDNLIRRALKRKARVRDWRLVEIESDAFDDKKVRGAQQSAHGDGIDETTQEQFQFSPADANAARTYFYDEWDARIKDYRPRWCRVVEMEWRGGDLSFANRTRAEFRSVINQVRAQFELIRPTGLKKLKAQTDGDDFDLEALTDLIIDRRARRQHRHSQAQTQRIYVKRKIEERDTAVCFLLDMSGSTNAQIAEGKSVLDVEKEALLLMCAALEAIGDAYAIYGFSGRARQGVEFYRFKEFGESYGERVERRIGAARGLFNTRLGAAIRHSTWRLNQQPSATQLLIILSDARPSDDDYNDPRYAREDTRMALSEARALGVTSFFITFDQKNASDALNQMFESTNYAVIDDALKLPERLPGIYRKLTA